MDQTKMINVRLKGKELQIFEFLCAEDLRNSSSMLRFLIVQEHNRRLAAKEQSELIGNNGHEES